MQIKRDCWCYDDKRKKKKIIWCKFLIWNFSVVFFFSLSSFGFVDWRGRGKKCCACEKCVSLFGCLSRCCHWISVGSIVKLSVVTMNGFVVRSSITVEKCNRLIESECCEWYTFWLNYKNKVITIVSNRIGIDNQQKSISSQWKITSCRGVFIVWTTILESLNWLEV